MMSIMQKVILSALALGSADALRVSNADVAANLAAAVAGAGKKPSLSVFKKVSKLFIRSQRDTAKVSPHMPKEAVFDDDAEIFAFADDESDNLSVDDDEHKLNQDIARENENQDKVTFTYTASSEQFAVVDIYWDKYQKITAVKAQSLDAPNDRPIIIPSKRFNLSSLTDKQLTLSQLAKQRSIKVDSFRKKQQAQAAAVQAEDSTNKFQKRERSMSVSSTASTVTSDSDTDSEHGDDSAGDVTQMSRGEEREIAAHVAASTSPLSEAFILGPKDVNDVQVVIIVAQVFINDPRWLKQAEENEKADHSNLLADAAEQFNDLLARNNITGAFRVIVDGRTNLPIKMLNREIELPIGSMYPEKKGLWQNKAFGESLQKIETGASSFLKDLFKVCFKTAGVQGLLVVIPQLAITKFGVTIHDLATPIRELMASAADGSEITHNLIGAAEAMNDEYNIPKKVSTHLKSSWDDFTKDPTQDVFRYVGLKTLHEIKKVVANKDAAKLDTSVVRA